MICVRCQRENPDGHAFCHACGAPLGRPSVRPAGATSCPRCGASNEPNAQFCRTCGSGLAAARVSAAPPPQARASAPPGPQCSRCGAPGDPGARFCKFCGAAYGGDVSGPAPADPGARSSMTPQRAQVVVILRDGSEGGVYPLDSEQNDVGSREGDIVLPEDPYLSPRHARIERRGDTFVLRDLNSVNGVYVRIREPIDLQDGDMILIGQQVLRFDMLAESRQGPARQHGVMVFGTPEASRVAKLVQYTTEGVERDVYYLGRDETVLGREQADIVFASDPFMSRRHAAIQTDGEQRRFTLRDLGSSNGTALRIRAERVLHHGDQFRIGRHLFRFDLLGGSGGAR